MDEVIAVKDLPDTKFKRPLILIAEDDKFLRTVIVQKFKQAGFPIEEAYDGKDALEKLNSTHPKVMLLDISLPKLDGFAVLKEMKEKPELAKIPVIVLSNLGEPEDIAKAKNLGVKDYLVKVYYTPAEIVARVEKLLREVYF